jgi:hypothetical protein
MKKSKKKEQDTQTNEIRKEKYGPLNTYYLVRLSEEDSNFLKKKDEILTHQTKNRYINLNEKLL